MPNMVDPYFAKSVIFLCEDDKNGTIGIIINKPISQMKIVGTGIKNKIFEDILKESEKIFFGGPVRLNEACIEKTPENTKLIFGHAAWEKNQLQDEIKNGDWLIQEYSDSVFKSNPKDLWIELIHIIGLDDFGFVGTSGVS